jgi:pyrimidine deaminase RibD-like protein
MPDSDRKHMRMAIECAAKNKPQDQGSRPCVGVVVVRDGVVLAKSWRDKTGEGDHAELGPLDKQLHDETMVGATVYTTLEPCTTENYPEIPSAHRLIERKIARVLIGMLDPNPITSGKGVQILRDAHIEVGFFHDDLRERVEEMNRDFRRAIEDPAPCEISYRRSRAAGTKSRTKCHGTIRPAPDAAPGSIPESTIEELPGRKVVWSTADLHAHRYYQNQHKMAVPLQSQLETLIALADTTILHCVDPARLNMLPDLMWRYGEFIESGRICFLMAKDVTPPYEKNYRAYLQRKRDEYSRSEHGRVDVETLDAALSNEDHLRRVVTLFELAPKHFSRGQRGTACFKQLVLNDLRPNHVPGFAETVHTQPRFARNLSLWQLLNMPSHVAPEMTLCDAERVVKKIRALTNTIPFSRQILLATMEDMLPEGFRDEWSDTWSLIERRVHSLYLRINAGRGTISEFDPAAESTSPYSPKHFIDHLRKIAGQPLKALGPVALERLVAHPTFQRLADRHVAFVSENSHDGDSAFDATYPISWADALPDLSDVRDILNESARQ